MNHKLLRIHIALTNASRAVRDRAHRTDQGQTASEYLGVILVVGALIGVLVGTDIGDTIQEAIIDAVESIGD